MKAEAHKYTIAREAKFDLAFNARWNMNVSLSTSPTENGENVMPVACIPSSMMASFFSCVLAHIGFGLHANGHNIFHNVIPNAFCVIGYLTQETGKTSRIMTISLTRLSMATLLPLCWRLFPWCLMASISFPFPTLVCQRVARTM